MSSPATATAAVAMSSATSSCAPAPSAASRTDGGWGSPCSSAAGWPPGRGPGRVRPQRLVAEVGIGHAGIVLGLEVSRLARNNADWHRLLEICALTETLILDEDGLYDPGEFNDRLLLGLKGTMSEAELHFIRARLRGGQLSKARRGELPVALPVGLVYDPAGKVSLDPDAGVQQALRHWRVLRTLHNPRYAGAFVYGRRRARKTGDGKLTLETVPREQWTALIRDAHAGYISWEQFETNQRQLAANAQGHGAERAAGPAREGPALLQGLLVCGRCGRRMTVRYHHRRGSLVPDYKCVGEAIQAGAPPCLVVPGQGVDAAIGALLLETVTPLALEVALTVQAELEARADEADRLRRSHVERARRRAELARRRYLAVDPGNRLVADTLEADWNDALRALQTAHDEYERASAAANAALSDQQTTRIRALAADFPALWSDPATPERERKRMVRLLIEDVTLNRTDQIHLHIRLRGGQTRSLTIPTPPNAWQARQTHPDTFALVERLLDDHTDAEVAAELNQAGHRSGMGKPFTAAIVLHLRRAHNLQSHAERLRARGLLTLREIADHLGVHATTIKTWQRAGLLKSEKANDKYERLYQPPTPGDPRLVKQLGRRLSEREPVESTAGGAV